ncbi:MAG: response regulator transcription factor [Phaeodactylibacter sp.]|nr:response regulator transcription factor [Phaeodactylibacter sp.]
MRKIRTIVVDDEPLARLRITNLLKKYNTIELLGEGKNGREALQLIQKYQPDLVFLDIQMPDLSGIDLLSAEHGLAVLPFIIFVTAYDQYAIKAFDLKAVDYLLKPYDDERFDKALEHARNQILLREKALLHEKMVHLIAEHQHQHPTEAPLSTLSIKDKGRTRYIPIKDVYYFEADGNYLHIHLERQSFLLRSTLAQLENQLPTQDFIRIHRSLLVQIHHLQQIKYQGNNQYLLTFPNQATIQSSRSYKENIEALLREREQLKRN